MIPIARIEADRPATGATLTPRRIRSAQTMHDKFKKRVRPSHINDRLKRQIATEAARRLLPRMCPEGSGPYLADLSAAEYEVAKRQAVAVLGQRVRPGDLPSDSEVRAQVLILRDAATRSTASLAAPESPNDAPGIEPEPVLERLTDHLDRYAVFKLRLEPLQGIKLNPRWHPEGDALFHSLQVYELARDRHPYDEEFLLAALLHDVGRAIDPNDACSATLSALADTITERTAWLIRNLPELLPHAGRPASGRPPWSLRQSPYFEDLELLAELDLAGREPGVAVSSVDQALAYIRALEEEVEPD